MRSSVGTAKEGVPRKTSFMFPSGADPLVRAGPTGSALLNELDSSHFDYADVSVGCGPGCPPDF